MCDHEPPFGFPRIQWLENRPAVCALNIPNLPGFAHIDKYCGKLIFQEVKFQEMEPKPPCQAALGDHSA